MHSCDVVDVTGTEGARVMCDALPDVELMRGVSRHSTGGNELNTTHYRVQFR